MWLLWLIYHSFWSRAKERTKSDRIFNSCRNYSEVYWSKWKSQLLTILSMISVNFVCGRIKYMCWKCFALLKRRKIFIVFTTVKKTYLFYYTYNKRIWLLVIYCTLNTMFRLTRNPVIYNASQCICTIPTLKNIFWHVLFFKISFLKKFKNTSKI